MAFGINERLALLITADGKGAVRELEKIGTTADRELGKLEKSPERIAASLTRAGAAFLTFGGIAAVGLFKAAQASSDLAESVNLTEQIFGDAANEIGAFAATAATSLGQSERAAREATATFGGLLQNLQFNQVETVKWSKELTVLASDLGSAFNTDPADAVLAIGAALRGESEPIRRFNVMLSDSAVRAKAVEMGLAATKAEVDAYGKAQATIALIIEQTNAVQGDFARTADGAANSQRILNAQFENMAAQLGQAALPVLTKALGALNDVVGAISALDQVTGGMVSTLAVWGTGLSLAVGAAATLSGWVIKLHANMANLSTSSGAATSAIGKLGPVVAVATAAVIVGVAAWRDYQQGARQTAEMVDNLAEALRNAENIGQGTNEFLRQLVAENEVARWALDATGTTVDELAQALAGSEDEWAAYKRGLLESGAAAGTSAGDLEDIGRILDHLRGTVLPDAIAEHESLGRVLGETSNAADDTARAYDGAGAAAAFAAADAQQYVDALEENERAAEEAEQALRDYTDAVLSAISAELGHASSVNRTEDAIAEYNRVAGDAEATNEDLERAMLGAQSAAIRQAEAAVRMAEEWAVANGQTLTAEQRNKILVVELTRVASTLSPGSPLQRNLLNYIAVLKGIPPKVSTTIDAPGVDRFRHKVELLLAAYGRIPGKKTTLIETRFTTSGSPPPSSPVPKPPSFMFPTGGVMPAAGPVIDSQGHRLAGVIPGEMVLNARQQARLFAMANGRARGASGGSVNVTVNVTAVGSPEELGDIVADAIATKVQTSGTSAFPALTG